MLITSLEFYNISINPFSVAAFVFLIMCLLFGCVSFFSALLIFSFTVLVLATVLALDPHEKLVKLFNFFILHHDCLDASQWLLIFKIYVFYLFRGF